MKTRCSKCDVPYILGIAIDTRGFRLERSICMHGPEIYNYDSAIITLCWKCPKCGESEELDNEERELFNCTRVDLKGKLYK